MKKPTEIIKYTEQEIVTPPIDYLEKLHTMNPAYVEGFFAGSRSKQEFLQTLELKRLDNDHLQNMAPFESRRSQIKTEFLAKSFGLASGLIALISTLIFIAYLVSINRADIAGFSVLLAAIALLISKFLSKK